MRTTISLSISPAEVKKTKTLARKRGFMTVSDYLRFLLSQDDADLISETEILRRGQESEKLYRQGKLIKAKSLADLV